MHLNRYDMFVTMNTNVEGGGLGGGLVGHVEGGQAVNVVCLFVVVLPAVWPAPLLKSLWQKHHTLF